MLDSDGSSRSIYIHVYIYELLKFITQRYAKYIHVGCYT